MKKYVILAAAAALVMTACVKTNVTSSVKENVNDGMKAIGFANYTPKAVTKAAAGNYVSGTTLVENAQFAVYAWNYANDASFDPSATPGFMNPAVVTYKNDNASGVGNEYTPVRYWPSGDSPDKLAFIAYYPANGAGITAANGLGEYTFTAQATDAEMVDFLVADLVPDQVYGATNKTAAGYKGTVDFTFHHMLTRVGFKFKKTDVDATIKITSAKLVNVQTTGTLTVSYADGATSTAWSNQATEATPKEYTVFVPTDALTTTAAPATVANDNLFLMVPQTMLAKTETAAQYLEIEWTVESGAGDKVTNKKKLYLDEVLKADAEDADGADIDWAKNMSVTYTITIGPKPIWFTATVADWDEETTGYFVEG